MTHHKRNEPGRVTFYARGRGEVTFTTDPEVIADAFLTHPYGQKAMTNTMTRRHLSRFLATYLNLKGAVWVEFGKEDPMHTLRSFDTVRSIVATRIADST